MKKIIWAWILFCTAIAYGGEGLEKRVLIGSPVRQKPGILREYLDSLNRLEKKGLRVDYYFVEGNTDPKSIEWMEGFAKEKGRQCLIFHEDKTKIEPENKCNEETHYWQNSIIWKIARFKDQMIEYARDHGYDYLFLIDSDLVLHPQTLLHLIHQDKEIISEIFWTKWTPDLPPLPSVWLSDLYNLYEIGPGETLPQEEIFKRQEKFLSKLREPGVYEIGELSACTLISKKALDKAISFGKIKNVTFWGEDRHFCIRAAALGIPLYVDTHYPAFHIYRESDLSHIDAYKKTCGY